MGVTLAVSSGKVGSRTEGEDTMVDGETSRSRFVEEANYLVDVGEGYTDDVLARRWRWATEAEVESFAALGDSDPRPYARLVARIRDACPGTLIGGLQEDEVRFPLGRVLKHLRGATVIWMAE